MRPAHPPAGVSTTAPRAAIYVRRSTDEHQAASLEVQTEQAKRFIAEKGWSVADSHVYVDDAISRAEFKKRPALIAMLNAADGRAFEVVVTRDETRLGGDATRTGLLIQDLLDSGIHLFYYASGEQVRLDDATAKFVMAARNFASELEREKVSQRTHEHLLTKARRGFNVGGRVFGYRNVEVMEGDRRLRVEYAIDEDEANVVRDIYRRHAAGEGVRAIAKSLNERRIPSPRAGKRGTGSWAPSSVWCLLRNERYRGRIVWNRQEKTYRKGTKVRVAREACDWTVVTAEHLRIVSEDEWLAVRREVRPKKASSGAAARKGGRPFRYLLSGILRCAKCGGALTVINGRQGSDAIKVYTCAYHRDRGEAVCDSSTRRPLKAVNASVIDWIRANVLSEQVVEATIREVERRLRERTAPSPGLPALETEARTLRDEIGRLAEAIATSTTKSTALVTVLDERQDRLHALEGRLRAAKAAPEAIAFELARLRREARKRITDLREAMEANPEEGRRVVQALFDGPLTATTVQTADGPRFEVAGIATIGRMLAAEGGVSNPPVLFASPAGFEAAE